MSSSLFLYYSILFLFHGYSIFCYLFKDINYSFFDIFFHALHCFWFFFFLFVLVSFFCCWRLSSDLCDPQQFLHIQENVAKLIESSLGMHEHSLVTNELPCFYLYFFFSRWWVRRLSVSSNNGPSFFCPSA